MHQEGRLAAEVIYEETTSHTVKAKASYHYDAMGRVLAATSFSRIPTTFEYDDLGRLEVKRTWRNDPLIQDATGVKITNHYNALGQLAHVHIDDASGCGCAEDKWYGYDAHGRMAEHTGVVDGATLTYSYDDFGQLAEVEYPKDPANWASKAGLDYTYDLLGRMATVDDGAAADPLAAYRYNMASEITDVTYANGARVKYRYNAAGQVAAVTNYAESGTAMSVFEYDYNADGLRTRVDREDGSYLTYEYDTLNRLTKEEKKNSGGTVLWRNRFSYDVVGNRTKWHKYVNSATTTYNYTYNTLNQLTEYTHYVLRHEFTYDFNGNRTKEYVTYSGYPVQTRYYAWDQDDHLIRSWRDDQNGDFVDSIEFRYCRTCSGNRTEKIKKDADGFITEWLRYEMEGLNHLRIDERYDSPLDGNSVIDDNDPWRVQRVYYNGPGQLGQIVKATVWDYTSTPTPTDYYYCYDILGNVSVISNNSGVEVDQFEQDAFGNEVEGSWSSPAGGITEHLTTKQYDADLGLYYFNARWYDGDTGAFISRDPDRNRKGSHTYSMCANLPTRFVDPTGRKHVDCDVCGDIYILIGESSGLLSLIDNRLQSAAKEVEKRMHFLYPNADNIIMEDLYDNDDLISYIRASDTIGIWFFGHGINAGLYTKGWWLAYPSDLFGHFSDLQFFVAEACESGQTDEWGGRWCRETSAGFCEVYMGSLDSKNVYKHTQDLLLSFARMCNAQ